MVFDSFPDQGHRPPPSLGGPHAWISYRSARIRVDGTPWLTDLLDGPRLEIRQIVALAISYIGIQIGSGPDAKRVIGVERQRHGG
jgi:hypothetical protein